MQNNQDAARGKVARLRYETENARERANDLAKEYDGLAKILRDEPTNLSLENYADGRLCYRVLSAVVADIKRAEKELYEATEHAEKTRRRPMTDEILVDKRKFDAILKRMIATKPTPHKEMPSQSKAKKRSKKPPPNPFKVGDKVVFDPDRRTIGLTYSSFDRLRIHPG